MLEVTKENLSYVKDTINAYRSRKRDCLEGIYSIEIEEKEWGSATEDLQKGHVLQHKRLAKRGFQVELGELDVSRIPFWGNVPFLHRDRFFYDGEYPVGCCRKKVKRYIRFTRNQESIGEFHTTLQLHYYTAGEPGEDTKVSCEDVFYTGEPFAERAEYWDDKRWLVDKVRIAVVLGVYGLLVAMAVGGFGYCVWPVFGINNASVASLVIMGLLAMISIFCSIYLKEVVKWYRVLYDKRKLSKQVLQTIQKEKPNFCMEKFISIADSRIKSIYYLEDREDVRAFVSCDLTDFDLLNRDVLHCDMTSFWFDSFYQDDTNQYLETTHRAMVFEDAGGRIKQRQCMIKVRFARPIESIMATDYYYDWYMDEVSRSSDLKGLKWEVVKSKDRR